ncbi:MAG: phage portal protein [Veillonella parvula]
MGSEQRKTMCTAIDYYDGKHDILNKQRYVIGEGNTRIALRGVPNNQIVDNRFDANLVDQKVNYLLSKPSLDINTDDDELDKMFGIQFQRLLKSVGKFATMAGKAYIHPYIGIDESSLKFKMMKPHQVLPFWADEEHTQLDAFLFTCTILK